MVTKINESTNKAMRIRGAIKHLDLLATESLTDSMLDLQLILARLIGSEQPLLVPVITLGSGVDAEVRVLA